MMVDNGRFKLLANLVIPPPLKNKNKSTETTQRLFVFAINLRKSCFGWWNLESGPGWGCPTVPQSWLNCSDGDWVHSGFCLMAHAVLRDPSWRSLFFYLPHFRASGGGLMINLYADQVLLENLLSIYICTFFCGQR